MSHPKLNIWHLLRGALLRRGVALAFLLGMAAAYASPVLAPRSMELLCSASGAMKLLSQTADGEEASVDVMHCGLCAPSAAPPPALANFEFFCALAYATQRSYASALAARTRPPLPARGPPSFS